MQTCWPVLVNETVPGHGLECWDTVNGIADSPQRCFCQGQTVLFQKTPGYIVGDSMGSLLEAALLKGKRVQPYGCRTHMDIYSQRQRMGIDPFCLLVQTVFLT